MQLAPARGPFVRPATFTVGSRKSLNKMVMIIAPPLQTHTSPFASVGIDQKQKKTLHIPICKSREKDHQLGKYSSWRNASKYEILPCRLPPRVRVFVSMLSAAITFFAAFFLH